MKSKKEYRDALNRMEEAYFNLDNSMSAMSRFKEDLNLLMDLANKADAFNDFKCSNHEPELEEYHHTQTLYEYQESKLGEYCANRPLEDILQAVTNMYEENFMFANKDLERVKNNLKEWLDADAPTERWNEEFKTMVMSIYKFKRRKDLFDDFLDSVQWIKNQYEVVKRRWKQKMNTKRH